MKYLHTLDSVDFNLEDIDYDDFLLSLEVKDESL